MPRFTEERCWWNRFRGPVSGFRGGDFSPAGQGIHARVGTPGALPILHETSDGTVWELKRRGCRIQVNLLPLWVLRKEAMAGAGSYWWQLIDHFPGTYTR
ncbi:MAG: hypothetical protein ACLU4J_20305 [Butyricimonas paravirosa]